MNIKQEVLSHYMGSWGEVTVDRDPTPSSTKNGLLYSGLFYSILAQRGLAGPDDLSRFQKLVRDCEVKRYGFIYQGLYNRTPDCEDLNAHDDYIGIAAASFFFDHKRFAHEIVHFGSNNFYSYDNEDPTRWRPRTWFARHPGLITYFKMCAGIKTNPISNAILAASILADPADSDKGVDGRILTWLKISVSRRLSTQCERAAQYWEKKLRKGFANGMNDVFAIYFGKDHPIAKYY